MIQIHPEYLHKDGKPQFVVLPYEEFLDIKKALARQIEQKLVDPKFGGFWDNLSAEEHARRQNATPVTDGQDLSWPHGPQDWEGFEEAREEWNKSTTEQ